VLRRSLGPRFVPEALFIGGVALLAALLELPIPAAIGLTLAAWLLVAVAEIAFAHPRGRTSELESGTDTAAEPPQAVPDVPEEPAPVEVAPAAVPVVKPEADSVADVEPAPEPQPELVPPSLAVVPAPEPQPEPEPAPEPNVVEFRPAEPREWNVWDLERRARERAGLDAARDEEWSYLLRYLRDFASPEGTLPRDFDPLIRESFEELIGTR
jgi:outer membrane biosynthesis protein TonB